MALDVALARLARDGEGVLRIYRWSRPTLSLGRNQPARDRYDPMAAARLGAEIVRRPTGGREVMHDRELTYAVVAPLAALGGLREAYRTVNDALLAALRSLGVAAKRAARGKRPPDPGAGPCFGRPAEGEVVVRGRKLVGSAQARFGKVLLQHGSLLLGRPSVPMTALAGAARGAPAVANASDGAITLAELLSCEPGFPAVAAAVEASLAATLGGEWARGEASAREREVAAALLPHYESVSWTWRR